MADPSVFKLFRTVDPSKVNVPIKEKFAKLTLSSNKKNQKQAKVESETLQRSNVSRQLLSELNDSNKKEAAKSYEHPLLRSSSSSSLNTMGMEHTPKALQDEQNVDVSDYMETLQLSAEACTQQTLDQDADVEQLATQVSNLTVQQKQLPQEISICISSTTEEELDDDNDDDVVSCITISDTSASVLESKEQQAQEQEQNSMAVSGQPTTTTEATAAEQQLSLLLCNEKVQRIEAFLRDVSFERHEMLRRAASLAAADASRLAAADTESMSQDIDCTKFPSPSASCSSTPSCSLKRQLQLDSNKRLADNDTEVNTLCSEEQLHPDTDSSKRLAQNDTEVNTLCSEEQLHPDTDSSKRLAQNDTELNTLCSEEQLHPDTDSSKRLAQNDTDVNISDVEEPLSELSGQQSTLNDSVTIPETSSETEKTPPRSRSSLSTVETESEATAAIQVSSINISAKINIKIQIPKMDSSSPESESDAEQENSVKCLPTTDISLEQCHQQEQQQERSILSVNATEDDQFLTQAERLLNQLYGKSWQTPDVLRTLKRSSGSGGKPNVAVATTANRTPLIELRRQPKTAATTAKKRAPPPPATPDESALVKRALHATKLNSTHLPRGARTEKRGCKLYPHTNHVDEERWRKLIDTDSGTDASDDEDANETGYSGSSDADNDDGQVTYLDLTKAEVEVVSNPDDEPEFKSSEFPKRLDDILRTCRATDKRRLPATPSKPTNSIRRQLFTPNTGYEDDKAARRIVDQALDLDSLEQLENVYLPGTTVHKRLQEVKKQLGIPIESPNSRPVFKLPTPKTAPPAPRSKKLQNVASKPHQNVGKCSFIKSLEMQISRDRCDNEAFFYRENFGKNKEQLAKRLYDMFNEQIFNNELNVPITWSKLLRNTAGRCKNKNKLQDRSSVVELSVKVLTSADRLRCTLIHELCHAAAWVFNAEGGHGRVWRKWAQRANDKFPDLPPIRVCHNYNIEFKYTYKCTNCNTALHAHSRSRKVENLRCRICRGPIMLLLNKKDKSGNIVPTPVREATGFAKFVKDNFQKHKRDNLTAAQVMRILGAEYAKEKGKGQLTKADEAEARASIVDQVEALVLDDDGDHDHQD